MEASTQTGFLRWLASSCAVSIRDGATMPPAMPRPSTRVCFPRLRRSSSSSRISGSTCQAASTTSWPRTIRRPSGGNSSMPRPHRRCRLPWALAKEESRGFTSIFTCTCASGWKFSVACSTKSRSPRCHSRCRVPLRVPSSLPFTGHKKPNWRWVSLGVACPLACPPRVPFARARFFSVGRSMRGAFSPGWGLNRNMRCRGRPIGISYGFTGIKGLVRAHGFEPIAHVYCLVLGFFTRHVPERKPLSLGNPLAWDIAPLDGRHYDHAFLPLVDQRLQVFRDCRAQDSPRDSPARDLGEGGERAMARQPRIPAPFTRVQVPAGFQAVPVANDSAHRLGNRLQRGPLQAFEPGIGQLCLVFAYQYSHGHGALRVHRNFLHELAFAQVPAPLGDAVGTRKDFSFDWPPWWVNALGWGRAFFCRASLLPRVPVFFGCPRFFAHGLPRVCVE